MKGVLVTGANEGTDAHGEALSEDFGFLLSRASGVVAAAVNRELASVGLRVRSYSVLTLACEYTNGVNQRRVAATLGLDPSQIVALVDELENRSLVTRRLDPSDRRNKVIVATNAGRELFDRAQACARVVQSRFLDSIPDETLGQMRQALRDIAFRDDKAIGTE